MPRKPSSRSNVAALYVTTLMALILRRCNLPVFCVPAAT
jgi:hypothetical protein